MDNSKIEDVARHFTEAFREDYKEYAERLHYDPNLSEMTDEDIRSIVIKYFGFPCLTEANDFLMGAIDTFVPDAAPDFSLDRETLKTTPEYAQWSHHSNVSSAWYSAFRDCDLENRFCKVNGKLRTNIEAATLAADKWCELIFNWHLQDNGALNEDHPGGFAACALGTVLADKCRENITDEMKEKARDLFINYYLNYLEYHGESSGLLNPIGWAEKNLPDDEPDPERRFNWGRYGFHDTDMYCDYHPYTPLYLVLVNAGIDGKDAMSICPWKTGISIRPVDNAVFIHTYQHKEELK